MIIKDIVYFSICVFIILIFKFIEFYFSVKEQIEADDLANKSLEPDTAKWFEIQERKEKEEKRKHKIKNKGRV